MQASAISDAISDQGGEVVGPIPDLKGGLQILERTEVDAAVLDVGLPDGLVFELADLLNERKVPFLFVTGYSPEIVPERFSDSPIMQKPWNVSSVMAALAILLAPSPRKQ